MKNIGLTLFILVSVLLNSYAQSDTLLWEDFEAEEIDYIENSFPDGDPNLYPIWLNFDVDGIADGSGVDRPGEWFLSSGFADQDSTNTVLASSSWLNGFANGAENWLVTPRIHIQDGLAVLYWKSAPFQLPRYMDGYQVLVSTTDNVETSFTDTLAIFAEFDGNLTTDVEDTATYVFTPGVMHTSIEVDTTDHTRNRGVLQQWEASLADYSGMNIHIAFRHRSDDDNLISIDDILITGTGSVGITEVVKAIEFGLYPNPAAEQIQVDYELHSSSDVSYFISTVDGKRVTEETGSVQASGRHMIKANLRSLERGTYLFTLVVDHEMLTERFVIE